MVIRLSCSSGRVSSNLNFPASFLEMILFEDNRQSERVVFPGEKIKKEGLGGGIYHDQHER